MEKFNNWTFIVTSTEPLTANCPFDLPDIDNGTYCKVYRESLYTVRIYLHCKNPYPISSIICYDYKGTLSEVKGWRGSFWEKVNTQQIALQVWELGVKPNRSCPRKRTQTMSVMNIKPFCKKYKI